jgi:hypothetical protein
MRGTLAGSVSVTTIHPFDENGEEEEEEGRIPLLSLLTPLLFSLSTLIFFMIVLPATYPILSRQCQKGGDG